MKCIVPLAGPDFVHPTYGVRPLIEIEGAPLVARALDTRPWRAGLAASDYVFVLRDVPQAGAVRDMIKSRWPGAGIVTLSALTGGAMFSAAAGLAMTAHTNEPICVDLVDILFTASASAFPTRDWPNALGGMAPYFHADEPQYSYLVMDSAGSVSETAEKRVISNAASAGVYFFKNSEVYFAAMAHSIAHRDALAYKGAMFICPMMNGVLAQGLKVNGVGVADVRPIGKMFH